jgi:predicted nucleic acid-binding protein
VSVVVDASVIVESLITGSNLYLFESHVDAPAHARLESASAVRSLQRRGALRRPDADAMLTDLMKVPLRTWEIDSLLPTAWGLRDEVSIYDGLYVALAIHLDSPLFTLDRRLQKAAARHCNVVVPGEGRSTPRA